MDVTTTAEVRVRNSLPITSETIVFGFRLWHIVAIVLAGLLALIVLCCCCMDCRIPRTKAEIEADHKKKKMKKKMAPTLVPTQRRPESGISGSTNSSYMSQLNPTMLTMDPRAARGRLCHGPVIPLPDPSHSGEPGGLQHSASETSVASTSVSATRF
ncbi:uncharacterized protein LOC106165215 [Lingula anatina]|uniref:Uncharacterized protein LOC106165215 n=1 Tax=Lingula anatina TaxID=7574 RepID=A0A1S3ILL2_LINAN|nr:uncharacterized protein LOC106165215 [Lingula anatina]|eukprot:XP_013398781.1 uncharacterized protein LOC106165215 [Lingula anatina]